MKLLTIDFETAYDTDYSLKKMTTEEYIRDPRFEVIGCSVKLGSAPTDWMTAYPGRLETAFKKLDWSNIAVLAHNTKFDGAILEWKYGVRPAFYFDTLSMAQAIHGLEGSLSLDALTQRYGLGQKGDEVVNAKGKRLSDFGSADLDRYGEYCSNDVELTLKLFHALRQQGDWKFPTSELAVIDLMLRMFIRPTLQLDRQQLEQHLEVVVARKEKLLARVEGVAGKDALMSNDKLAMVLRSLGIEPPMKLSPAALKRGEEKLTYAFGKSDLEFKALLDHDDERVQAVVAARMGVKSTQAETRAQRFIQMSGRGPFAIPLRYHAAHTGRAGGDEKVNVQNLPSRTGDLSLRKSIIPPPGHSIVTCDSAQIEARVLAYLAGQWDLVEDFRRKVDIYSSFASDVYGYPVDRKMKAIDENGKEYHPHKVEGMVGKECVAGWTPVLTERGWVPIVEVTLDDKVWDGCEWVHHSGVLDQGTKEALWIHGLCATPDHEILTERGWVAWREVNTDKTLFQQARDLAVLPSSGMSDTSTAEDADLGSASVPLKLKCRVYDLANAGPRHRFTVLTDHGPVVVSNCILGLGFGMGHSKFQMRLKQSVGINMSDADAKRTVGIYRKRFAQVPKLWRQAQRALSQMVKGYTATIGVGIELQCYPADDFGPARIALPNGMFLRYPELRAEPGGKYGDEYRYTARKGRKVETIYTYGAKIIENIVQALARIIVFDQMLAIDRWMAKQGLASGECMAIAMTVHDEADAVTPDHAVEETEAMMLRTMSTPPTWAPDLPVFAETGVGKNYGDA